MNRRSSRRRLELWGCIALLLTCWVLALSCFGRLAPFSETVGLRYAEGRGLTAKQIASARETAEKKREAFPDVTLWTEKPGQTVTDGGARSSSVRLILFSGSGEAVLPVHLLAGSCPAENDAVGCAVDRRLALALWGSENAAGNRLTWNGGSYTVRGVFDSGAPLLLLPAGESGESFSAAELRFADSGDPLAEAEAFLTRHGLPAPDAYADAPLAGQLSVLLLLLPGWAAAGWQLARLLRRVWQVRNGTVLLAAVAAGALALGWSLLWAVQAGGTLPVRFIPSRWSDFSFWGTLADSIQETLRALLAAPVSAREAALLGELVPLTLTAAAALFILVPLLERISIRSGRELFFSAAAYALLLTLTLWGAGFPEAAGRSLWLGLPGCFAVDFLLRRWDACRRSPNINREERNPHADLHPAADGT